LCFRNFSGFSVLCRFSGKVWKLREFQSLFDSTFQVLWNIKFIAPQKAQNRRSLKTFPIDIRVKIDFHSNNFSISFRKNIWTWAKNLWKKTRRKLLLTQRFVLFFEFKIYWKQQQDKNFTKLKENKFEFGIYSKMFR
jgi:hypothetical protein